LEAALVVLLGLAAPVARAQTEFAEPGVDRESLLLEQKKLERRYIEAKAGEASRVPATLNPKVTVERLKSSARPPASRDFFSEGAPSSPHLSGPRSWRELVPKASIKEAPSEDSPELAPPPKGVAMQPHSESARVAPGEKPGVPVTKRKPKNAEAVVPHADDAEAIKAARGVAAREKRLFNGTVTESAGHVALGVQSGEHSVPVLFSTSRLPFAPSHERAIAAIADVSSGGFNSADKHLRKLGFELPADRGWSRLSAVEKIRTACQAAETAAATTLAPGEATTAVLAKMSRSLAQQYPAVRAEPDLQAYLRYPAPDTIAFSAATSGVAALHQGTWLTASQRSAIAKLANYAESGVGYLGGHGVLTRHFNLTDDEAFDLLRSSGSVEKALIDATKPLSTDARDRALAATVQDYVQVYPSLRPDPDLAPYLQASSSPPVSTPSNPSGPRGPPSPVH
jgi:hypothetical protein